MLMWFHKQLSPANDFTVVSGEHEGEDAEAVFTRWQQECLVDIMFSVYVAHVNWKVQSGCTYMWTERYSHVAHTWTERYSHVAHMWTERYSHVACMWTERYGHVACMWTERYGHVAHVNWKTQSCCTCIYMWTERCGHVAHVNWKIWSGWTCELKDTVMVHAWI